MNILTMTEPRFQRLKAQLCQRQNCENLSVGFLTSIESTENREFLLRDDFLPATDDYRVQSAHLVSLKAESLTGVLQRARDYQGVMLAHNHLGDAFASPTDEIGITKFARNLKDFQSNGVWLQLIQGRDGIYARIGNTDDCEPLDRIKIISDNGIQLIKPLNSRDKETAAVDEARHTRTLNLLGESGPATFELMRTLKFGFIGAGGVMSAFADVFKFFGPNQVVIVDDDCVERSNANRLFGYHQDDDGARKVDVMRRELLAFDPEMNVETVNATFPDEAALCALKSCDVWIVGPDNHFCRYWSAHYSSRYLKPLLEFGSGIRLDKTQGRPVAVGSHFRLQLPTETGKCLVCNGLNVERLISPQQEAFNRDASLATGYIQNSDLPTPASVVTINAIAATLGCRTLLAYFSGVGEVPSYVEYNELSCEIRNLSGVLAKNPDCPICGDGTDSVWGWGDTLPPQMRLMDAPEEVDNHAVR